MRRRPVGTRQAVHYPAKDGLDPPERRASVATGSPIGVCERPHRRKRAMSTAHASAPLTFKDPDVIRRPFQAYEYLRDQAPVFFDPGAGFFVISRYDDIRAALRDTEALNSEHATEKLRGASDPVRDQRIRALFAEKGWPRERPMGNYEGPEHRELRDLFERFLRAGKVRDYDPMVRDIAYSLVEGFAPDGQCEIVSQYAEQLSVRVICGLLGAPEDAFPIVKASMAAMVANLGLIMSEAEEIASAEKEIAAQHYFKAMIDRLRDRPDDTILSAFVNTPLPSGRTVTDAQILMHVMLDLFMAGAETTSKAIASGVLMLCRNPEVYAALQADPETHLRTFAEEVLRLEGPASGLFRVAQKDFELHGVGIPKGSVVTLRIAAANRDPRHFGCPADLDLERPNAATHLSFGAGVHSCVGAPLARRELYWGFKALLDRVTDLRLAPGETGEYTPNMLFRAMDHLDVTFTPRSR
jgi:cytochrome P450